MAAIAMFGGSFSPPHNGHLILALEVMELASLDRLIVVPTRRSPLKEEGPLFSGAERHALLTEIFASEGQIEVSDLELHRPEPSYTVDTVEQLCGDGADAFGIVIGEDTIGQLHRWHRIEDLAARATFLVARRPGNHPPLAPSLEGFVRLRRLPTTLVGVSSTQVRARHAAGRSLIGFVPAVVQEAFKRASSDAR